MAFWVHKNVIKEIKPNKGNYSLKKSNSGPATGFYS